MEGVWASILVPVRGMQDGNMTSLKCQVFILRHAGVCSVLGLPSQVWGQRAEGYHIAMFPSLDLACLQSCMHTWPLAKVLA